MTYCIRNKDGDGFRCSDGTTIPPAQIKKTGGQPQPMTNSGTLEIDLQTTEGDNLAKCLRAEQKGELGTLTRDDFANALDHMAERWAARDRVPVANAYLALHTSPEGAALYRGYCAAPAAPTLAKGASRREPPCSQPQRELDRLAQQRAEQTGETFWQATSEILKSDRGRELYEEIKERTIAG